MTSTAGWIAAGDNIRIPQAADVTVLMTITESIDGAAPTPVNLTAKTVKLVVQRRSGDHANPLLTLSSGDVAPRLTVVSAVAGTISVVFVPADFPTAVAAVYRVVLLAAGETAGKPYGSATFAVDAT